MRAPRMVLRMMMKGAAKTSSGTAAKVAGAVLAEQPEARRPPCHGLVAGRDSAGEGEAERKRKQG